MANTMTLISSQTLASAVSSITFSSIPSTYTDLLVIASARGSSYDGSSTNQIMMTLNGSSSGYSTKTLGATKVSGTYSAGSGTNPYGITSATYISEIPSTDQTASTFGNTSIYIPNYLSSNYKSFSIDTVAETNTTQDYSTTTSIIAGLWSNTASVSSLTLSCKYNSTGNFQVNSTFYLYGVKNS